MKKLNNKLAILSSDIHYKYTQSVKRKPILVSWRFQKIIEDGLVLVSSAKRLLCWQISTKFSQMNDNVVEQKME